MSLGAISKPNGSYLLAMGLQQIYIKQSIGESGNGRGLQGRTDEDPYGRCRRQAWMNDVCRPAAGAGKGRGGGMARGLRRATKPQSSTTRLCLVSINWTIRNRAN